MHHIIYNNNMIESHEIKKNNFSSSAFTTRESSQFSPKVMFSSYHYYELYDPDKEYIVEPYIADYGHGNCSYINIKYTVSIFDGVDTDREFTRAHVYIVAKEELTEDDQQILAQYCQCDYHTAKWYNPLKYFICKCCIGCLDSDSPQQHVINKTREYVRTVKTQV